MESGDTRSRIWKGALIVVVIVLIIAGIVMAVISLRKSPSPSNKNDLKQRAFSMDQNMDTSVDPCKNFFKFSCGNYKVEQDIRMPLPNSYVHADRLLFQSYLDIVSSDNLTVIPLAENLRDFHNACLNIRTHSSKKNYRNDLRNILIRLRWPPLTKNWNSVVKKFNWLHLEEKLIKMGFINSLLTFHFMSMQDKSQIIVCQCCNSMVFSDFSGDRSEEELIKKITEIIGGVIRLLEGDEKLTNEIVQMYIKIEKIKRDTMSRMLFRDTSSLSSRRSPLTLGEVEKQWKIEFVKFCRSIFPSYMNITESTKIQFAGGCPFRLVNFLKKINYRPFAGYMLLEGIMDLFWIINDDARKINRQYRNLLDNTSTKSDHQECYVRNMKLLPDLWGYVYTKAYSTKARREKVLKMVHLMLDEGKALINNSWLSDSSKKVINNKLSTMKIMVDYDDKFVSDKYARSTFANLKFNASDIIKSVLHMNAHNFKRKWIIFHYNAEDRVRFAMHVVPTINAFNDRYRNMLIIPGAIIKPIFYSDDFEAYQNFGGLGGVIGHEIFHTIDEGGLTVNDKLEVAPWLNEKDKPSFDDKINCFVKQYSNYKLSAERHVNGRETIDENLADAGLLLAYRAYLKWLEINQVKSLPQFGKYNDRQRFWITFANSWCENYSKEYLELIHRRNDPHTIGKLRVLGTLSNFEEFAKDFNCPVNSAMNPKNKCKLYH